MQTLLLILSAPGSTVAQGINPGPPARGKDAGLGTLRIIEKPAKEAEEEGKAPRAGKPGAVERAKQPPLKKGGGIPRAEWPQALHRASEAYDQGDHARAAALYGRIVKSGLENGYLYYNLGNSLVRSGQLGRGIAAYLRGRQLMPRDQDTQANLDYARKNIKDAISPIQPSALLRTLFFWHYSLSWRELLILTGLTSLLFWAGVTIRLFRRESEALRWVVGGLLLLLLAGCGSLAVRAAWPLNVAVVARPEVKVRSATSRDATVLFKLHEGTEAEVISEEQGWLKISLSDGKRGWVEVEGIDVVRMR